MTHTPSEIVVVDSHHHFWRLGESEQTWRGPEHGTLERDFLPSAMGTEMQAAGVRHSVLIQSVNEAAENVRLLEYSRNVKFVAGVIAWLPLRDHGLAHLILAEIAAIPAVRGVRYLVGRDELGWLLEPETLNLFREIAASGFTWDIVPVTDTQAAKASLGN